MKTRKENLWNRLKKIADRDGYTIKLIVYLRRQDDFVASVWNQRLKMPVNHYNETDTWHSYIENCPDDPTLNLDYYSTLQSASNVLGRENIIVRRYDRNFLKDGLSQADFLDALGLELTDEYVMSKAVVNPKLSLNGCEIKRIINGMEKISLQEHRFFQKSLTCTAALSEQEYPRILWNAAEADAFMNRYAESNQKIADVFIQDGLPLFENRHADGEVWQPDNPQFLPDVIRFAASSDLQLLRAHKELQQQVKEQRKEIQELKKQLEEIQGSVNMLRQFRQKFKHPLKTLFRKLLHKSE